MNIDSVTFPKEMTDNIEFSLSERDRDFFWCPKGMVLITALTRSVI